MSKENEVFTDDLVKRLRSKIIVHTDVAVWILEAADRIEELEAKLAGAVEALEAIMSDCVGDAARCGSKAALAELKGLNQ